MITRNPKHPLTDTKTFWVWCGIRRRHKGLISDRWLGRTEGFSRFVEDLGECPEGHSLTRIDETLPYGPENCKWGIRVVSTNIGKVFGFLRVMFVLPNQKVKVLCLRCSKECIKSRKSVYTGNTKSCGCYGYDLRTTSIVQRLAKPPKPKGRGSPSNKGNPLVNTRTHTTWRAMLNRCLRSSHSSYKHYGGRGITIDSRWTGRFGFTNFLEDMGERPAGRTLDRIDNDGNYTKANCRWATTKEQAANTRISSLRGGSQKKNRTQLLECLAAAIGISFRQLQHRIKRFGPASSLVYTPKYANYVKHK